MANRVHKTFPFKYTVIYRQEHQQLEIIYEAFMCLKGLRETNNFFQKSFKPFELKSYVQKKYTKTKNDKEKKTCFEQF